MNKRARMSGTVLSNKMNKTVIVEIQRKVRHSRYHKEITRKTKVYAHTDEPVEEGAVVTVEESKPISRLKRWVVVSEKKSGKSDKK
ncbi:MAG: uS17 family ribosomal protein [Candidatus Dojkabacteria bacterium]|nr:uS17 family ribosomal protein [Candidatus Dojkabacteria bacterium]